MNRKRRNFFLIATILSFIFIFISIISTHHLNTAKAQAPEKTSFLQGKTSEASEQSDLAPMIYVSSHLYIICNTDNNDAISSSKWTYVGQISSCVDSSLKPQEELQANDEIVGAKVYNSGEKLLVKYNEKQWIYQLY